MTARTLVALVLVALFGLAVAGPSTHLPHLTVPALAATAAGQEPTTSTLDDQVDLAVTVYNSDIAMVRDTRTLRLGQGVTDLHFMDIAATVNPASVHFRSLTDPTKVNVLEQNYEYDLLEPDKLLRKTASTTRPRTRRST